MLFKLNTTELNFKIKNRKQIKRLGREFMRWK